VLGLLKALYRVNHHRDFTVQERKESASTDFVLFPGMEISVSEDSITLGAPQWKGVPVERKSWGGEGMSLNETKWLDWYFVEPHVSVLGTFAPLYNLSAEACNEVSERAGL
jgi:hypothetical protein